MYSALKRIFFGAAIALALMTVSSVASSQPKASDQPQPKGVEIFQGLVYIKHANVGSKSEGPVYFLQTFDSDYALVNKQRELWQPDVALEPFSRKMVSIEGIRHGTAIEVRTIVAIDATFIPPPKIVVKSARTAQTKGDVSARIKIVRQMYEKIPPLILGITEPVQIVKGAAYEDGGTTILEMKDSKDKTFVFHLDRKIGSPTRDTLFIAIEEHARRPVVLRGAEEAALYGLLLRWKAPAKTEWRTAFGVEVMLGNLDDRFAAEAKAKTSVEAKPDEYLTPQGQLKQKLVIRDTGGFAGAGTGRRWVIEPSGEWLRVAKKDGKTEETRGQLSRDELRGLAGKLARYDLRHLPKEVNKMTVADGFNVVIEFGELHSLFYGKAGFADLPKPGDTTPLDRFAAIVQAVQQKARDSAKPPSPAELRSAPEQVELGGRQLKLETYLWRDFMPISPPDGRPLAASIKLKTVDGMSLPDAIQVLNVWVVNRDDVWATPFKNERTSGTSTGWTTTASNGPKWGPNIFVDVVLQLQAPNGQVSDRNRNVLILATLEMSA